MLGPCVHAREVAMPYANVNDLTMYYEEHGRPDGPPLVLLHGFTATGALWTRQLDAFGGRYRLLVPDLRGHGRTANPGGLATMNHRQFARDIIALCRALGIARAAFCGASTGAMLLLTLGLEAPDLADVLVLAGGTYCFSEEVRAIQAGATPEAYLRENADPAGPRERHAPLGPEGWRTVVEAFSALSTHAHGDDFPAQEELRGLTTPTLIVHGDRDRYFPVAIPATLYGLLPDAELCILPKTGHGPSAERPAWYNAIVLDFLDRRWGSAALGAR
jgi:pimeloyl-ACP methyl ester carboxylesterase